MWCNSWIIVTCSNTKGSKDGRLEEGIGCRGRCSESRKLNLLL